MTGPTVSAIVPVHNGAQYIAAAIRSIRSQTRPVDEVIVVDDGSTDATVEIVRRTDPHAILICQPQGGPARARNAGAAQASGTWLAFLDHDDLWPVERTAALLRAAAANPLAGLVCGRTRIEEMPGAVTDARLRRADGTHVPFLFHSLLVRRDLWLVAGGMSPAFSHGEDLDLYLRLIDAGVTLAKVDADALVYRQHAGNRSRLVDVSQAALLTAMRGAIRRRRE